MASREVLIALKLIGAAQVEAGLQKVSQAVAGMGQKIETVTKSSGKRLEEMGRNMQRTGRVLSVELTAPIVAFGKVAVDKFVAVDTATRRLQKVFSGTAAEMNANLIPAAQELALYWGMNKVEIIDVMQELAAMGFQTQEIIDGTTKAVEVSKLGNLDLAKSMDLVVAVMQNYGVTGKELTQTIADINAVEDAGAAQLSDFSVGLGRVASIGKLAGLGIKEVGAMMSVLIGRGEKATLAARSLKTVFSRIIAPTAAIKDEFERLGISIETTEERTATLTKTIGGNSDEVERLIKLKTKQEEKLRDYIAVSEEAGEVGEKEEKQIAKISTQISAYNKQIAAATGTTEEYVGSIVTGTGEMKGMDDILKELAVEWKNMDDIQKMNTATVIAGRHHVDRFIKMMDDGTATVSEYDRIIKETSDDQKNMDRMMTALGISSGSAAVQFGRLNAKFDEFKEFVGRDIVPIIVPMIDKVLQLAKKFTDLDEGVRKNIIKFAMFVAALGPVLVYLGVVVQAIGVLKLGMVGLVNTIATRLIPALMLLAAHPLVALTLAIAGATTAMGLMILKSDILITKTDLISAAKRGEIQAQSDLDEAYRIGEKVADDADAAKLRQKRAVLAVERATRTLSEVTLQYGKDSLEAREQELVLEGALGNLEVANEDVTTSVEDSQTALINIQDEEKRKIESSKDVVKAVESEETAWGNLISKIGDAISKIREWFTVSGVERGVGTRHEAPGWTGQHGGIVPGAVGTAVPIMAHGGERVIPTTGVDVNSGLGTGGITVNITGSFNLDSSSRVNELANRVSDILGRRMELAQSGAGW